MAGWAIFSGTERTRDWVRVGQGRAASSLKMRPSRTASARSLSLRAAVMDSPGASREVAVAMVVSAREVASARKAARASSVESGDLRGRPSGLVVEKEGREARRRRRERGMGDGYRVEWG